MSATTAPGEFLDKFLDEFLDKFLDKFLDQILNQMFNYFPDQMFNQFICRSNKSSSDFQIKYSIGIFNVKIAYIFADKIFPRFVNYGYAGFQSIFSSSSSIDDKKSNFIC